MSEKVTAQVGDKTIIIETGKVAKQADGAVKLPDGRIQCISCHDPHNTGRHAGMLVKSDHRSNLCLTCHRL